MAEQRLIDANVLIDWLTKATGFRTNCDDCTSIDCLDCIIEEAIKNAPTIKAKPVVHAHWFLLDDCANEGVYCSACTKKVYKTDYANQKLKSKYCPNCGAQMDEKED